MFFAMLMVTAQVTASAPPPPPPPSEATKAGSERNWRKQVFIAPSGEPFRVDVGAPYPIADWFSRADTNHDGKLTADEFAADFLRFAATLDVDHDGVIDATELDRYESVIAPEVHSDDYFGAAHAAESGDDGGEGSHTSEPERPQGAGRYGILGLPEPVVAMDVNLNGRITRQEVVEAASYRFQLLDMKHQGYLSLDELPATPAQSHPRNTHAKRQGERGDGERGRHSHSPEHGQL